MQTHKPANQYMHAHTHTHRIHLLYIYSQPIRQPTNQQYNMIQEIGQHIAYNGLRWAQLYVYYYSIIHANLRLKDGKKPQISSDNSISYIHSRAQSHTVYRLIYLLVFSIDFKIFGSSTYLSEYKCRHNIHTVHTSKTCIYTTRTHSRTHVTNWTWLTKRVNKCIVC